MIGSRCLDLAGRSGLSGRLSRTGGGRAAAGLPLFAAPRRRGRTTHAGITPGVDAYLWIKDPGGSDGPCNGGPAAGQYWAWYAEQLAQGLERHGQ